MLGVKDIEHLIANFGFPIAIAIALVIFIFWLIKKHRRDFSEIQKVHREERTEWREIHEKSFNTLVGINKVNQDISIQVTKAVTSNEGAIKDLKTLLESIDRRLT